MPTIFDTSDVPQLQIHVLVASHQILQKNWYTLDARQPYGRLYYISSGTGQIRHHNRLYRMEAEHFYLIPEDSEMEILGARDCACHWCHFLARNESGTDPFQGISCEYELPAADANADLAGMLRLREVFGLNSAAATIEAQGIVMGLLGRFLQTIPPSMIDYALGRNDRLQPVIRHIDAHLRDAFSIPELASMVHLEQGQFRRVFRERFGVAPSRYILERRMHRARMLLLGTDHAINEIAEDCGFCDQFHFAKTFKRLIGNSPSEYRKRTEPDRP